MDCFAVKLIPKGILNCFASLAPDHDKWWAVFPSVMVVFENHFLISGIVGLDEEMDRVGNFISPRV